MIGVRRAGERGVLVELASLDEVMAFHARVAADPLPGQVEQVAAARTVLLMFRSARQAAAAADAVRAVDASPVAESEARAIDIDVVYDGDDLDAVAELTGLSRESVIAAHTSHAWTAAFGGFAPGFAYLAGEDERLRVPRRETPRTAVPAGSVALAGEFSAVYPRSSPGGWQLIGRTDARMWDLGREHPALVAPGDAVQFRAVRELVQGSAAPSHGGSAENRLKEPESSASRRIVSTSERALEVVAPGLQSLIQDLGRPGHADLGVPVSGAADRVGAAEANRLVGNPAGSAVVESLFGGLTVRAAGDHVVAFAGAEAPATIDDDELVRSGAPFLLRDGETLAIGMPEAGLRTYLAVRGGIDAEPVLGSRSTDTLSGLGPDPLAPGARVATGDSSGIGTAVGEPVTRARDAEPVTLRIVPGPRNDWFDAGELAHLQKAAWTVSNESNRVGVRLAPSEGSRPLRRSDDRELPSEGVVAGSLQVPPSGEPVLFLADHPVTGGYPVIAVVSVADLSRAAQLRPGERVRFRAVSERS
ncbi:5-oxoprolinase/urea amidolyase family protein [Microbacterium sp. G2-8]|uniref:5-oxoprolinase subunit B/C family protein n=1 Tax=Microbacterium sp. G2-8 TaxID=2842454 RepID=UPI001C89E2AB|nr:5-oxoprolinase/urea amidolyase family protein [Microbacterium sp. G2-8]